MSDAQVSSAQTSDAISVAGLGVGVSVPVTVSGGTHSINGGTFTADIGWARTAIWLQCDKPPRQRPATTVLTIGGHHAPNNPSLILGVANSAQFVTVTP